MSSLENYKEIHEALNRLVDYFTKDISVRYHCPGWLWDEDKGGINFSPYKQLLKRVREDIRKCEKDEAALKSYLDDPSSEDYILTHSALRINGYKYRDATDLDMKTIFDEFRRSGTFGDATPLDKLAYFCLLQRFLYKWGGERLERDSVEWKMFRTLFLQTVDVEVPEAFFPGSLWTDKWEYRIKPRIKICIEIIENAHKNTRYV